MNHQKNQAHIYFKNVETNLLQEQVLPKVAATYSTNEIVDNSSRYKLSLRGRPFNYSRLKLDKKLIRLKLKNSRQYSMNCRLFFQR